MLEQERSEWVKTLLFHAARYPKMEPTDAVKLAYQSVFGGGHLVKDEASSLLRLCDERASVLAENACAAVEPFEPIGFGRARMMLSSGALAGLPDTLLNRAFVLSSGEPSGNTALFREALAVLEEAVIGGVFSFSPDAFSVYLSGYRASGCPMASHSESYRLAYRPAYRVLNDRFVQALTALVKPGRNLTRSKAARALNALPPESAASLLELIPFSKSEE
ncbi:MAG: hypothetical protein ABFD03_09550 [Clostridiaceae bacterium]